MRRCPHGGQLLEQRSRRLFTVDGEPVGADEINERLARPGRRAAHREGLPHMERHQNRIRLSAQATAGRRRCRTAGARGTGRASEALGNTRTIARAHYVHPDVIDGVHLGQLGEFLPVAGSRAGRWLDADERLLLAYLAECLERRAESSRQPDAWTGSSRHHPAPLEAAGLRWLAAGRRAGARIVAESPGRLVLRTHRTRPSRRRGGGGAGPHARGDASRRRAAVRLAAGRGRVLRRPLRAALTRGRRVERVLPAAPLPAARPAGRPRGDVVAGCASRRRSSRRRGCTATCGPATCSPTATGRPWLIDPAAYGGHREVDLAMLDLFGHIPAARWPPTRRSRRSPRLAGAGRAVAAVPAARARRAVRRRLPAQCARPRRAAGPRQNLIASAAAAQQDGRMPTFRELHRPGDPLLLPNPWDAGSARILAALGYQALATTSSGFAATLGRPDMSRHPRGGARPRRGDRRRRPTCRCPPTSRTASPTTRPASPRPSRLASRGRAGRLLDRGRHGPRRRPDLPARARGRAGRARRPRRPAGRLVLTARAENHLHGRDDLADTIARLQRFQEAGADVLYAPGLHRRRARSARSSVGRPAGQRARAARARRPSPSSPSWASRASRSAARSRSPRSARWSRPPRSCATPGTYGFWHQRRRSRPHDRPPGVPRCAPDHSSRCAPMTTVRSSGRQKFDAGLAALCASPTNSRLRQRAMPSRSPRWIVSRDRK